MKQDLIAEPHNMDDEPHPESGDAAQHATQTRRRALLAVGAIGLLLAFLWLGDVLSGIVPHRSYHPATQHAGPYAVTLIVNPNQPSVNGPIHIHIQITDASHQPIRNAAVNFVWNMVAMDMGTTDGHAIPDTTPGTYDVTVASAMSGYWRLSVTIHSAQQTTGATSFDIPVGA